MDITQPGKRGKVGILHAGHREYWPQFAGAREDIIAGAERFAALVGESGVEVVMSDLVDSVELAYAAGRLFERSGIDLLFVYLHTYVASGRWAPGLMHLNVPIVVVTTPERLDFDNDEYVTGMSLHIGSPCQVPEAISALQRVGKPPADLIFGAANGPKVKREIMEWCRVANALATYRECVIGYMGHSYEGMLDMNFDPTSITQAFGVYVKMLEMCELVDYVQAATTARGAGQDRGDAPGL